MLTCEVHVMNNLPFKAADILLPKKDFEKWACVACDQFTSQPDYWEKAYTAVGEAKSTLNIVLPEIYLEDNVDKRIADINENMVEYLKQGVFEEYKNALIYVERTLPDGGIRRGIVGAVDLDAYDFTAGAKPMIRPTEGTVLERIPPRVKIRKDAPLELPHVMLLIDDEKRTVIESLSSLDLPIVYDFDLLMGGGHIKGYLIDENIQKQVFDALYALVEGQSEPFLFAVGDGNHSLATAKVCHDNDKSELSRFALCEIVNIHDESLVFEPIYRVIFGVNERELISGLNDIFKGGETPIEVITNNSSETFYTNGFPVGALQDYLDEYLKNHPKAKIDYIHGEDVARNLASKEGCVGFIFGGMQKSELFPIVADRGVLPRKSFSMGEAASKRYYLEARKIK